MAAMTAALALTPLSRTPTLSPTGTRYPFFLALAASHSNTIKIEVGPPDGATALSFLVPASRFLLDGLRRVGVWSKLCDARSKLQVCETFDDMGLDENLLRGIFAYGFEKPSAIQQRGTMPLIKGRDTIAQAQSGTGKTAAFSIGCLQRVEVSEKCCQALLLAPTRELAQQIQKVVLALGDYMQITCHACIGGTNVREDIRKLESGQQVVVGTPGRVHDMINRRALRTDGMKIFVLDEADEMLSRG